MTTMRISSASTGGGCGGVLGRVLVTGFLFLFLAMGLVFTVVILGEAAREIATFTWSRTTCTVESSQVDVTDGDDPYRVVVRYHYLRDGRRLTGTRVTRRGLEFDDVAAAERTASRYPAGAEVACWVDPNHPSEAVLERRVPYFAAFVLLPLVFVAIGAGGIYAVWRQRRPSRAPSPSVAAVEPISQRGRGINGRRLMVVLGSIFLLVGLGLFVAIFVRPMLRLVAARGWVETPCTIISSTVGSHSSDDGTTYSIDILYRYQIGAQSYRSNRYDFASWSSSGYEGKREIVDGYPPGSQALCFVDPENPHSAVLNRSFRAAYLVGLFPLLFAFAGAGVLALARRSGRRSTRREPALESAPSADPMEGPLELEPAAGPIAKLAGSILFALLWNGIVSVFVWQAVQGWRHGEQPWFLTLFLVPFVLVGIATIAAVGHFTLALANPRPHLTLSPGSPRLGSEALLEWRLSGRVRRLDRLRIVLEGREEATYRRGTDTRTDREVFARRELTDTTMVEQMRYGSAMLTLPSDTMHSFEATHNKIVWTIKVSGEIPRWPDVDQSFPVVVRPLDPRKIPR